MSAQILITGASGLVGSHILLRFSKEGVPVRAIVRNPEKARDYVEKIASFYFKKPLDLINKVEFVKGDLNDLVDIEDAVHGIDAIIHCAGMVSFAKNDCKQVKLVNTRITADMVNIALEQKISWFCHISSVAALGEHHSACVDENILWDSYTGASCYAISKYEAELEVYRAIEEGLNAVIFCPSVVTGPGYERQSLSGIFKLLRRGMRWYIEGGTGYIDARDIADAVWFAWTKRIASEKFILNSENLNHKEIMGLCAEAAGLQAPKKPLPAFVLKLANYFGAFLFLPGIGGLLSDIKVLQGTTQYSGEKFSKLSGTQFRDIRPSIKLMKMADDGIAPEKDQSFIPGW